MARGPRISYPNAVFHVINRFVDRHPFFQARRDYVDFLDIFFDEAATFGIWTYAYDLMPSHFHIVLETPSGDISQFLQRWLTRVSQGMNRRKGRVGHLFQGRTKTLIVETERYFSTVMGYVLTNRVRAGLAKNVFSDEWNSVHEMLTLGKSRLARGPLWEHLFGHAFDDRRARAHVKECKMWLAELGPAQIASKFKEGHKGSFLSTPEFRKSALRMAERRKSVIGRGIRRKTDRYSKSWTWKEIQRASAKVFVRDDAWKNLWHSRLDAVRQTAWYVAHVGAGWPWSRIRKLARSAGGHRPPNAMAVSRIRKSKRKKALADMAIGLCLKEGAL